jgi:diguanylate cyclase (GGDEF)-like protein/PAS domain S-box-containing protein
MPMLETLTVAAGLAAFGFLGFAAWRRWAGPRDEGGPVMPVERTRDPVLDTPRAAATDAASRNPDHPFAVVGQQPLFRHLADAVGEAVLLHDDEIGYANLAAKALLGGEEPLAGRRLSDLMHPESRDAFAAWLNARRAGRQSAISLRLLDAADRPVEFQLSGFPLGPGAGILGTVLRPTRDQVIANAREQGTRLAEATLASISEGVITTDIGGRIEYMNTAAEALLGCSRDQARGRRLADLASLVDDGDRRALGDPIERCLHEGRRIDLGRRALLVSRAAGDEHSIELRASPIREAGRLAGCVVVLHDVSEIRGLARQMSYQASHDPLTGLFNRREFERRLDELMKDARAGGTGHVLCYLDLDRFKAVNDTCGHLAGDSMLREVAAILKEQVRDSDAVARIGGDEFGMLLIGCPLDKARQIADDICAAARDYRFVWRDRIFTVGVSVGLVEIGRESGSMEDALGAADSACYVAKQQGRGRVHVYSARDEAVARQRGEILWLQRLQAALKEDRFELYVQPIVSVAGRPEQGPAFEILLRLSDDEAGVVSPVDFMQAAERYHLMPSVDRWVLQKALSAVGSGALKLPVGRSFSINISGQTLGDPQFLEFVVDCLDRTGVAPSRVCFEIPESSVASNVAHAARFIAVLHGIGCQFALDDFGSGLGSFANLKQLAMDYLKIDGSFIRGLGTDDFSLPMVTAMIDLARGLGIKVVAEQFESEEALDQVRALKVDFVQGFIVGRPRPLAQAVAPA